MADPTEGSWVRNACPSCGFIASRQTYDIGSGPELSCSRCEWCWGADGQPLKQLPALPPDMRYRAFPNHPLHDVPPVILDAARKVMRQAAEWGNVDPDEAVPLADAVVVELRPWLTWIVRTGVDDDE